MSRAGRARDTEIAMLPRQITHQNIFRVLTVGFSLVILLLLAALDRRSFLGGEQRGKVPVPVWLTLGGWNPVTTSLPARAGAELQTWFAPAYFAAAAGTFAILLVRSTGVPGVPVGIN